MEEKFVDHLLKNVKELTNRHLFQKLNLLILYVDDKQKTSDIFILIDKTCLEMREKYGYNQYSIKSSNKQDGFDFEISFQPENIQIQIKIEREGKIMETNDKNWKFAYVIRYEVPNKDYQPSYEGRDRPMSSFTIKKENFGEFIIELERLKNTNQKMEVKSIKKEITYFEAQELPEMELSITKKILGE
jgi:hypothetical protein